MLVTECVLRGPVSDWSAWLTAAGIPGTPAILGATDYSGGLRRPGWAGYGGVGGLAHSNAHFSEGERRGFRPIPALRRPGARDEDDRATTKREGRNRPGKASYRFGVRLSGGRTGGAL